MVGNRVRNFESGLIRVGKITYYGLKLGKGKAHPHPNSGEYPPGIQSQQKLLL